MGYDLIARKKTAKITEHSIGMFSWPMFLQETGMGYILEYGKSITISQYVYTPAKNGGSPVSNDGYPVSSFQAKAMAAVARGFIKTSRFINKEWESIPEEEAQRMREYKSHDGTTLYHQAWHEDRLKQLEKFAEFAEQSGGFTIN